MVYEKKLSAMHLNDVARFQNITIHVHEWGDYMKHTVEHGIYNNLLYAILCSTFTNPIHHTQGIRKRIRIGF